MYHFPDGSPMDSENSQEKAMPTRQEGGSFSYKRVPHVMILPDGSKPVELGSGAVTALLGIGGMANVYEIWNNHLEMKRAVKLLHPNYSQDSKERFETEIKITAKLDHPNIVEIHAVGEWNGLPYIEMEKIEGVTLEKLVSDRGGLPFEVCTAIGIMVCRALRYAHSHEYALYGETYHGIIHRDLKPNNIMVSKDGIVKLMDFGIARPIDASIHTTDNSSVLGSMQYLSPETLEGKTADVRTDIYSLGAILYELVTGTKAFAEDNISKLMLSKVRNEFKPLDSFRIKIPARLRRIIQQCLSRERERRPQDAAVLLAELTRVHRSLTPLSPEAALQSFTGSESGEKTVVGYRRLLPLRAIAGALVVCAIVAALLAAGFLAYQQRSVRRYAASVPIRHVPRAALAPHGEPSEASVREKLLSAPKVARKPVIAFAMPVETTVPQPPAAVAPVDEIKAQYGTSDLLELLVKLIKLGKYQQASVVYGAMTAEQQQSKSAVLCRILMLEALGDTKSLDNVLLSSTLDDGEFYLAQAKYHFRTGNLEKCLYFLDASLKSRCEIVNPVTVRQDVLYYRALSYSREFDDHPGQATMKNAFDAWFEVKLLFRATPAHNYYQKAVSEMQRIADKEKDMRG
jgi:Protein kinase domain